MYLLFVVILLCCCCCCCCCCWLKVFIGELLNYGIHTKALFSFCEAVSTSYTPNVTHDSEADESPENVEGFQVPVTLIACHKDCRQQGVTHEAVATKEGLPDAAEVLQTSWRNAMRHASNNLSASFNMAARVFR